MAFIKNTFGAGKFGEKISAVDTRSNMNDKNLWIVDKSNREIIINPTAGLLAKDANGNIVHDIPDSVVSTDMKFMGHILFETAPADYISFGNGNTGSTGSAYTYDMATNASISSFMPTDLTNVKGVWGTMLNTIWVDGVKTSSNMAVVLDMSFSHTYGTTAITLNRLCLESWAYPMLNADDIALERSWAKQVMMPITTSTGSTNHYITIQTQLAISGMSTLSSGEYGMNSLFYINGWFA